MAKQTGASGAPGTDLNLRSAGLHVFSMFCVSSFPLHFLYLSFTLMRKIVSRLTAFPRKGTKDL